MATPTIIRSHTVGDFQVCVVATASVVDFKAYCQIYRVHPNGRTTLVATPGGAWPTEEGAVGEWERWIAEQ